MNEIVGQGHHRFRVNDDWARLPPAIEMRAAAVTVDARDRVYCFNRVADHPVLVFERDGTFVTSWGAGLFDQPHAIRFDAEGMLWLTDGYGMRFMRFTPGGVLLREIGERGKRSVTGVPDNDLSSTAWRRVHHSAGPFNIPTDIAFAADGTMFMTDGYGNARVHRFGADGSYQFSWRQPGAAPAQFNLPHGIWIDRHGRLLVCDRENNRVQVFDQNARLLGIWPVELIGPAFIYVDADDVVYIPEHNSGMISVLTLEGERLARWGEPSHRSCHGVWGDSHRDIYIVRPGAWNKGRRVVKYERV